MIGSRIIGILFLAAGYQVLLGQSPEGQILFSLPGGFYDTALILSLHAAPGTRIYYTLDGNKPGQQSNLYRGPLRIANTTVVRAVAYQPNGQISHISGQTYFIGEPLSNFPIVSLGAPPGLLFDPDIGLFVTGNQVDTQRIMQPGANFWTRRELVAHAEIFEPDGQCVFNSLIGVRIFGGVSRVFPQKSLALVARERYGEKRIYHPIFGKAGPKHFKYLVLRNAGSDFGRAHFRDALISGLLDEWDIDKQAYRPAHVYINGQYWGIYNLREKINRYFIAAHHGVDKDSIDLLEHRYNVRRGSRRHYVRLLRFLETRDLAVQANYEWVKTQMDVDNFLHYQIAQIYCDNRDAGGNIKYWRPQTPNGRWRWILYDTDWGFGLNDDKAWQFNSLRFHTAADGPHWPNPPWSTFILRKLLENPEFRQLFLLRFCDHLNTTFHPDRVLAAIEDKYQHLLPEMPRHLERWRLSRTKWERHVDIMRQFARARPAYMFSHLQEFFQAGDLYVLYITPSTGGKVLVNDKITVTPEGGAFRGQYFATSTLHLKAVPEPGYRFVRWEGLIQGDDQRDISLRLARGGLCVKAVFEPFRHPLADKIVINEVSPYNSQAGDWIEIYNTTRQRIDMSGWVVADAQHETVLPSAEIGPHDYLILCRDEARFRQAHPQAHNVLGALDFGLHRRKDYLALFSADGALVDQMQYELPPGGDSTLTIGLLLPHLPNENPHYWERYANGGTPAAANPYYVESRIEAMQREWLEMGIAAGIILVCMGLLYFRYHGQWR